MGAVFAGSARHNGARRHRRQIENLRRRVWLVSTSRCGGDSGAIRRAEIWPGNPEQPGGPARFHDFLWRPVQNGNGERFAFDRRVGTKSRER